MEHKAQFAERLKAAMREAGYEPRPSVLERGFNQRYWGRSITFQAASRWLRGESIPEQDKLEVLAEWLRVEPQALRFGETAVKRVKDAQARWDAALNQEERETIEAFLNLPAPQRKIIREVILTFARAYPAKG
ncbi:transcriptional regulator [Crenobacter cavernae]|uniref:Transcriptional regulator n=2 Tax=Crenobacter cavernae TaxID=2290923 RepID=A0ABY0FD22_9NEIS|nr:transcriptional regulator [Crenobacter cavernae]